MHAIFCSHAWLRGFDNPDILLWARRLLFADGMIILGEISEYLKDCSVSVHV